MCMEVDLYNMDMNIALLEIHLIFSKFKLNAKKIPNTLFTNINK